MRLLPYCVLLIALVPASGCTPLAAISAIGTTVTNAAYNSAERDLNDPSSGSEQQTQEVAQANLNLGIEYMRQGDYEKALVKLERALQARPDFAQAYNVLGLLYQRLGDYQAAEANYKKAIKLEPEESAHLNNYGQFLCSQGRKREARDVFAEAAANPFYASPEIPLSNAGVCSLEEDKQLAQDFFKRALEKNPYFAPALLEMAELSYQNQQFQRAHEYFLRFREVSAQSPRSLWLGIRICHELGYEDDLASYALLLRNQYPDTNEAQLLRQSSL